MTPFRSNKERRAAFAKLPARTLRSEPGRVKGWTHPISPATHGAHAKQLLRQRFPQKSRSDHEADAARFEKARTKLAAAWNHRWKQAFGQTHGRVPDFTDYRVAGIGDDRLPEADKEVLRGLAQAETRAGQLAHAHREAGKHLRRRA